MPIRMMAKRLNPRLVITEDKGVWTIRTESTFKTMTVTFTPGVEFEDSAPDGQKLQVCLAFFLISLLFKILSSDSDQF